MTDTATRPAVRRLQRRRTGSVIAGVAGGVADHVGVPVFRVRLVFVLLVAAGGAGFFAYAALWVFGPLEPRGVPRTVPPGERQQGAAMATLGVGLALALSAVGDQIASWVVGPLGIALIGVAVVWREADTDGRFPEGPGRTSRSRHGRADGDHADGDRGSPTRSRGDRGPGGRGSRLRGRLGLGRRGAAVRLLAGAVLVTGGIVAFLVGRVDLSQVQFGLLAAVATLTGVAVLTVPWWLKLVRELSAERRARIRTQERAEIAAHLHDSVLQTLALIQKQSADDDSGREVRRLARRQERELRSWLYSGEAGWDEPTLVAAVMASAAEVEDTYGVQVAPVLVGDVALTDDPRGDLRALVAAAREAMVNAAKHSGADEVSVYVEAEIDAVEIFVRDRGRGFDLEAVPADRHGLADSVHERMTRHGGRVRVRTGIGDGTEVALSLPRRAPDTRTPSTPDGTSPPPPPPDGTSQPPPPDGTSPPPRPTPADAAGSQTPPNGASRAAGIVTDPGPHPQPTGEHPR